MPDVKEPKSRLTPRQELFVQEYVANPNASAAYAKVYDVAPDTAKANASRLLANANMAASLATAQQKVAERAQMTVDSHMATLAELRDLAIKAKQYTAAITAETNRGKVCGLYVERTQDVTPELTGDQRAARALELFAAARARVTSGGVS